jgi:hypothetical protein
VREPNLWKRQPGETARAFAAFQAYRDLPSDERSVEAAYRLKTGLQSKTSGQWSRWSSQNRWIERAAAWEEELIEQRDRERIKAEKKATEQLVNRWKALQLSIFRVTEKLAEQLELVVARPIARQSRSYEEMKDSGPHQVSIVVNPASDFPPLVDKLRELTQACSEVVNTAVGIERLEKNPQAIETAAPLPATSVTLIIPDANGNGENGSNGNGEGGSS